jgi:replication factor A1
LDQFTEKSTESGTSSEADSSETTAEASESVADGELETFTGTVVQPGDPVILDSGDETVHVETNADVHLGQEITVRGRRDGETFLADDVF